MTSCVGHMKFKMQYSVQLSKIEYAKQQEQLQEL